MEFYTADTETAIEIPMSNSFVEAGYPSPSEDFIELKLDLNKHLIKHPSATFYVRVKGNSMENANIFNGDLLIVDKALEAENNSIAICVIDGDFTVKRLKKSGDELFLIPENPNYKPIKITDANNFQVWGIVSFVIHKPE